MANIEKAKFNLRNMINVHKWIEKYDKNFVASLSEQNLNSNDLKVNSDASIPYLNNMTQLVSSPKSMLFSNDVLGQDSNKLSYFRCDPIPKNINF